MAPTERGSSQDLATTTLAEIYAQQGLYERALAIYQRLADLSPGERAYLDRIEALTAEMVGESAEHAAAEEVSAASVVAEPQPSSSETDAEFERWLARR